VLRIRQRSQRVRYELREIGSLTLFDILKEKLGSRSAIESGRPEPVSSRS
jgi:hypothetical protein